MTTPSPATDPFLVACQGGTPAHTPVWFMRQAGRSLPEYRSLRGATTILEAVRQPELAAEVTLQPLRRYAVDAAILFSDIMVPLWAVGFGVDVVPGIGPTADRPFATAGDLGRLRPLEPPEDTPWIAETVRILVKDLRVPLIGFAGGPFTLASYLIEGRPSRDYLKTKGLMYSNPELWHALLSRLADIAVTTLRDQVAAGAEAVQVFDSWAGALSRADYREYVLPAAQQLFDGIADLAVPRIHFGVGTGELLGLMAEAGASVLGVDWRVPLDEAARRAPAARALQGNLDPAVCLAPWDVVAEQTREVLDRRPAGVGHVFNLGHGVLPQTDPATLARLADLVHQETRRA